MIRVRIKQNPGSVKTGEQIGYSLHTGTPFDNGSAPATSSVSDTLSAVDRSEATIEAERGETVLADIDQDGVNEHFKIGGEKHSNGGTPLNVPEGSFVFSDNKRLRIAGPVLSHFGKSEKSTQKFTPAQLAKQYDINKYKALAEDPLSDKYDTDTAELMIQNNNLKLGELALMQEGMKGFPNGIPSIAIPLLQPQQGEEQAAGMPMMKDGGLVKATNGMNYPFVVPHPGDKTAPRPAQQKKGLQRGFNKFNAPWLNDYGFTNDAAGFDKAVTTLGYKGDLKDNMAIQRFLISENLRQGNHQLFNDLQAEFGTTNQGIAMNYGEDVTPFDPKRDSEIQELKARSIYQDGFAGPRTGAMAQNLLENPKVGDVWKKYDTDVPFEPTYEPRYANPIGIDRRAASSFNIPTPPLPSGKAVGSQQSATQKQAGSTFTKAPKEDMPWWSQDVINTGAAAINAMNLKKYMPTMLTQDVVLPNATFFDPTRQLAANQEQAAQQNMLSAMYAGPQRMRSVGSQIQGQAAGFAANTLGQVENQNVQIANNHSANISQILNQKALQDAAAKKQYLGELAIVNQQFDNERMQAMDYLKQNVLNGMSNAQRTYWFNKMNQQYKVDPRNGRINFTKGRNPFGPGAGQGQSGPSLELHKSYKDQALSAGYSESDANAFADKMTFNSRQKMSADSDGDSSVQMSGYVMPQLPQFLSMYNPQLAR